MFVVVGCLCHIPRIMGFLRRRFPLLYRFAGLLALLAMLVPVGTSLVHFPAAQSFIHICGSGGHADNDQGKDPAHKSPSCPICQSLHLWGGGVLPPEGVVVADMALAAAAYFTAASDFFLNLATAPQARPRAPPAFV